MSEDKDDKPIEAGWWFWVSRALLVAALFLVYLIVAKLGDGIV